jgi:hypothetical protein
VLLTAVMVGTQLQDLTRMDGETPSPSAWGPLNEFLPVPNDDCRRWGASPTAATLRREAEPT